MKWITLALKIVSLVPAVVTSVEQIASGASGSTKKELAMQSLGLSSAVASTLAPEHQADIAAATQLASAAIDNTVAVYNFIGKFTKKSDTPQTDVASNPVPLAADHVVSGGFSTH